MRPLSMAFLSLLNLFLVGCDGWCRGKRDVCQAGEKYVGWPDCDCRKSDSGSATSSTKRAQWTALAICKTDSDDGIVAVWRTQPGYWDTYPSDVTIAPTYTGMSAALKYCPSFGPNNTQSAVDNPIHARIEKWERWQSLVNDAEYTAAYGQALRPMTGLMAAPSDQIASLSLPTRIVGQMRFAVLSALLENDANLSIEQCPLECARNNARVCIEEVPLKDNVARGLAQLTHRLATAVEARIPKAEVMKMFEEDQDPCDRSDLVVSDGHITNDGQACYLNAIEASYATQATPSVWLEIPAKVDATPLLRVANGDEVREGISLDYAVTFDDAAAAPSVGASDDKDYVRGQLRAAGYRSGHLYMLLPGGCVLAQTAGSK